MSSPVLGKDGAEHRAAVLDAEVLGWLSASLSTVENGRPGVRLVNQAGLAAFLEPQTRIGSIAKEVLGPGVRPVRAILFDKAADNNWALGWHQDRTIAVRSRLEAPGFGPWTCKAGILHVAPPWEILSEMLTLRVHLDPVDEANAPLLVALGSHRLGRIEEAQAEATALSLPRIACMAEAGDVWVYSTPILHASDIARRPHRRRVLQVDYAAVELPGGLEWLGIGTPHLAPFG